MPTISEVFLIDMPMSRPNITGEVGTPISLKTTPTLTRVDPAELELSYMHNPTIFNGINKIIQTIMSAKHQIVAKDQTVQKYFEDFVANLGNSGTDITWEELLSTIFKHQCIFGKAWVENIYNKLGNKIVDWDFIDPKKMDFARDIQHQIVLDEFGKPVGYFEKLPIGAKTYKETIIPPKLVQLGVTPPMAFKSIFIEPKRIAQFKLFTLGDGFDAVGLIEPIYKTSLRKMNMEEALANAIYRHGFPIIWAQLGDLNHEPSPQQISNMLDKLKDINFKQEIATPYYYNLHILESKKAEKLRQHLDYFKEQEIAGLGIPKPFVTGGGEDTNRATLGNQSTLFQLTLNDIVQKTIVSIQKYMFKKICDLEKFKEVPRIEWDLIGKEDMNAKANRLLRYVNAGVLKPDLSVADFVKKIENLE